MNVERADSLSQQFQRATTYTRLLKLSSSIMMMMAMLLAAATMTQGVSAQGCISMMHDTTASSPGSFCFELIPKPLIETEVTCVSSSANAGCCNGGGTWNFKPFTAEKCGSLVGTPTFESPATITCSAVGYNDGALVAGPPGEEFDSLCDADLPVAVDVPTEPPVAAPTDLPVAATEPPNESPTDAPTSNAGAIQTSAIAMVMVVASFIF